MALLPSRRSSALQQLDHPLPNESMSRRRLLLPIVLIALTPRVSHAQPPVLFSERQAAILESGRLLNTPAEFVLQHRKELALTDTQVTALERLASALRDSSTARTAIRVQQSLQSSENPDLSAAMEWTGPINESAIRDAMRVQSVIQADIMVAGARDRRLVGALLTPEQRAQLPELQMWELMKAARTGAK